MFSKARTAVIILLLGGIALRGQTLSPTLPGEVPEPVLREEAIKHDAFVIGLRVSSAFDDNGLSDNRDKQPNVITSIEPHVGWTLSHSRMKWMLDYRPGFSLSHPLSIYDSRSHLLDIGLHLMLTRRLQVRLRESLLESTNAFDLLVGSELRPGASVLDRPNNFIFTTSRASSEQGGLDLTYALTSRTIIGTSGTLYRVSYSSSSNTQQFGTARSVSGHGFYTYHLTRHNWVGLDFNVRDLVSEVPRSRALVRSVFYTETLQLTPMMSFSFFIGPEHSVTSAEPGLIIPGMGGIGGRRLSWSWAGGGNYVWSDRHNSLTVGLSRRISDGAGQQGIVQLSSVTAELRRQLTRQWKVHLLVSDDHNQALLATSTPLSYVSVASGLTRAVTPRLSLDFQYWRVHEIGAGAQPSPYVADHNRISTSLVYDLKGSLER